MTACDQSRPKNPEVSGKEMCQHLSSPYANWLPSDDGTIKNHNSCKFCGTIKNISSDQGKPLGHFMNELGGIKNELEKRKVKITKVQIRLISTELSQIDGFSDVYWVKGRAQRRIFSKIVSKYTRVSEDYIESLLS